MTRGDPELEPNNSDAHIDSVRTILIDAFKEVEPFAPVLVVREVDESGQAAYVSRPMLPVAETLGFRQEVTETSSATASISHVIGAVSQVTKYPQELITGTSGRRDLVIARHSAMYMARELVSPQPSYPKLGRAFHKDHSTVVQAVTGLKTLMMSHDPGAAAKKQRVSEIIERAAELLDQPYEMPKEVIEIKTLVSLCLQGLVASPIVGLKVKRQLSDAKTGLDWEQAEQTPEIYQRYGDAALRLARNVLAKAKQRSIESVPRQKQRAQTRV